MLFAELTNPMTVREEFGALKCWDQYNFPDVKINERRSVILSGLCLTCFVDDEFWLAEVNISSRSRQSFLQDIPAI